MHPGALRSGSLRHAHERGRTMPRAAGHAERRAGPPRPAWRHVMSLHSRPLPAPATPERIVPDLVTPDPVTPATHATPHPGGAPPHEPELQPDRERTPRSRVEPSAAEATPW